MMVLAATGWPRNIKRNGVTRSVFIGEKQLLATTTHLINALGDATRAKALSITACNAGLKARSSTEMR